MILSNSGTVLDAMVIPDVCLEMGRKPNHITIIG